MRNAVIAMLSLASLTASAQRPWTPATEGWVSNRLAIAEARIGSNTAAAVNSATGALSSVTLTKAETNGWTVSSHAGFLTAEQDLASLAALAYYAATSRVERVWEGSNAWYEFSANTVTRSETSPTMRWVLDVPETLQANAIDDIYPETNLVLNIADELPNGDAILPTWGNSTAFLSVSTFAAGKVSLVITVGGTSDYVWEANLDEPRTAVHYDLVDYAESAVVTLDWLQTGVTTNTTTYSLIHPPETWSSTDQTNWMEFGNAGQLWVTDLAFDAANVLVNGHLAATDPHPGKYVKLTGGAATNLALVNASVGGDTVIGAVAVSNAANVIVNGHLAATDPHAGRYVKLTGGAATNLTVVGTVAMPGVVTFSNGVTLAVGVALNGTNCWRMTDPTGLTNAYYPLPW